MQILLIIALVLAAFWFFRTKPDLELKVQQGNIKVLHGNPSASLKQDISLAVRQVNSARIKVYRSASGTRLKLDGDINDGTAQRLRNILGLHFK